jgi:hypothetical protein
MLPPNQPKRWFEDTRGLSRRISGTWLTLSEYFILAPDWVQVLELGSQAFLITDEVVALSRTWD